MADYDIRSIFEKMELELIRSMKRNLSKHMQWEKDEEMNWTMWQAEQLKTLEQFRKENEKIFGKKFSLVNKEIEEFLKETYEITGLEQEREILEALAKGKLPKNKLTKGLEGAFFQLNEDKMNALIKATTDDFKKAEHAMLRMTNDQYRKIIYKAQTMSNSGAFTLQQSIDMATRDFLKAGINCIEYKDGRRVNIASYAEMYIRTSTKRAALISEGDVRNAYGVHTVRISKYGGCSETCLPWQGRVYVDDVYSGGTKEESKEKNVPLLSEAIAGGLFHPNCKHRATTYFYDLKKEQGKLQDDGIENPIEEQEHRKNHLHIQQQKRLEEGSLDPKNISQAKEKKEEWLARDEKLLENYPDLESNNLNIMKFDKFTQREPNSNDTIDEYYKKVKVLSVNKTLIQKIKDDIKMMPIKDLEYLNKNELLSKVSRKRSYYVKVFDKYPLIGINIDDPKKGSFAHEFAHYIVTETNLYQRPGFQKVLNNVLQSIDGIIPKKYKGGEYIVAESPLFVRNYQGRTYIKKDDFIANGRLFSADMLEEYVSVGYETYISNPYELYKKDRMLYNYFETEGLVNGR